jgi:hypothetical protein
MIHVTDTRDGYLLSRDDAPPTATPFFIAQNELPALLAELLARETGDTNAWDVFAFLCGNDQIAPTRQAVATRTSSR